MNDCGKKQMRDCGKRLLTKVWLALLVVFFVFGNLPHPVLADDPAMFKEAEDAAKSAYCQGRPIVLGMAGLAILFLAASALFGRFSWGWFFTILAACGLAVLADALVQWLTDIPNLGCATP
jgi:hypothetical protein